MKMPALTIVLIFTIVLSYSIKKTNKVDSKKKEDFWNREREANFTRKKSLEELDFISIPENIIKIMEPSGYLNEILNQKIVNLNSISNTELKLTYGAANISALSQYDQNFTTLITALQKFVTDDNPDDATKKIILRFAVDIGTDIASSFEILSDLYIQDNEKEQLHYLIKKADEIKSFRGTSIKKNLTQKLDSL